MAFLISGGRPLYGSIRAQGAKNAALPILFASLLCRAPVKLYGVPDIGDVRAALSLLTSLGVRIAKETDGALLLDAKDACPPTFDLHETGKIRASSYLLGAAVSRFGEGSIPYPGGCSFGVRPLDYHRAGFEALGLSWTEKEEGITVCKNAPHSTVFSLPYPSVGATVNFILAALGIAGESTLYGYAREHHVLDFIAFLHKMGAKIQPEGNLLRVFGGVPLSGGSFEIPPDALEAGTYLIAAAATGGEVTVERVRYGELSPLLLTFGRMNIPFRFTGNAVTVHSAPHILGTSVIAVPYPGFPTDLHPLMSVLLSRAIGGGAVSDFVWEERYSYLTELAKMGFRSLRSPHTVRILPADLKGATVESTDLRGGAALVVAALIAEGKSRILAEERILRGYEGFAAKLFSLGADISVE